MVKKTAENVTLNAINTSSIVDNINNNVKNVSSVLESYQKDFNFLSTSSILLLFLISVILYFYIKSVKALNNLVKKMEESNILDTKIIDNKNIENDIITHKFIFNKNNQKINIDLCENLNETLKTIEFDKNQILLTIDKLELELKNSLDKKNQEIIDINHQIIEKLETTTKSFEDVFENIRRVGNDLINQNNSMVGEISEISDSLNNITASPFINIIFQLSTFFMKKISIVTDLINSDIAKNKNDLILLNTYVDNLKENSKIFNNYFNNYFNEYKLGNDKLTKDLEEIKSQINSLEINTKYSNIKDSINEKLIFTNKQNTQKTLSPVALWESLNIFFTNNPDSLNDFNNILINHESNSQKLKLQTIKYNN